MANDLNQCNFIGRLGKDPETKHTPSGDAVTNFSIAVGESWTKDGEKQERTTWVNVVAWRKLAEIIAEYRKKGQQVFISGKLQTRKYQDKDGNEKYITEVIADRMQMVGGKPSGAPAQERKAAPAAQKSAGGFEDMDDDIPF